jgi:S1-C subfamily serine protease
VRSGDIVLAVGGEPVASLAEFYRKVWARGAAGVEVPLRVLQGQEVKAFGVRSMDRAQHLRRAQGY